jgi:hypothetical protein
MKPQPVELRAIHDLPSSGADAFMDIVDGRNRSREGDINMNTTAQLRKDRAAMATVSQQLASLESMTVGELAEKFREVFGFPTRTRNKPYLRKRVAWQIQALAEGGLSPRALAKIEELALLAPVRWRPDMTAAGAVGVFPVRSRDPRLPMPGSVLVRVHKDTENRVTVLPEGFDYQGQRYASLSQIARLITGTPWNGFLFFGLQRRTRPSQPGEART